MKEYLWRYRRKSFFDCKQTSQQNILNRICEGISFSHPEIGYLNLPLILAVRSEISNNPPSGMVACKKPFTPNGFLKKNGGGGLQLINLGCQKKSYNLYKFKSSILFSNKLQLKICSCFCLQIILGPLLTPLLMSVQGYRVTHPHPNHFVPWPNGIIFHLHRSISLKVFGGFPETSDATKIGGPNRPSYAGASSSTWVSAWGGRPMGFFPEMAKKNWTFKMGKKKISPEISTKN